MNDGKLELRFLGAAGTVTGSRYLLTYGNDRILVDCGMFQGLKALRLKNWAPFAVKAAEIQAIILTHAHIDHSGYIPKLVREGFRGPIFCTPATAKLCEILLMDSAKIMEEEADYANRSGFSKHKPALPLFSSEDAERALGQFRPTPFGVYTTVIRGLSLNFKHAGHILGAASVRLSSSNTSVTFSGDVGRLNDPIMLSPENLSQTDYLVVESTYGDRQHPDTDPLIFLREIFQNAMKQRGSVLIPSFAVGRAQELLYYIAKLKSKNEMPDLPVYLDSPMAINASDLFCDFKDDHRLTEVECRLTFLGAKFVRSREESKKLSESSQPKVVISASGMATGGRVLHHLKKMLPDIKNTILFAGFQAVGTRGSSLVGGAKEVKIHGQYIAVEASIQMLDSLSAHADASEILTWLKKSRISPRRVFVTHGEPRGSESLKQKIVTEFGWNCVIPTEGESFVLGHDRHLDTNLNKR